MIYHIILNMCLLLDSLHGFPSCRVNLPQSQNGRKIDKSFASCILLSYFLPFTSYNKNIENVYNFTSKL